MLNDINRIGGSRSKPSGDKSVDRWVCTCVVRQNMEFEGGRKK